MGSYLTLLQAVARVVGGNRPTLAQMTAGQNGIGEDLSAADKTALLTKQNPYWYSGADSLDNSGVAGLAGCYALPVEVFGATPVGMVLPDSWTPLERMPFQGHKDPIESLRVRIIMSQDQDILTTMGLLVDFRDLVETAFDTHMGLNNTTNVGMAYCGTGRFIESSWGGKVYYAIEFTVSVLRNVAVTRSL